MQRTVNVDFDVWKAQMEGGLASQTRHSLSNERMLTFDAEQNRQELKQERLAAAGLADADAAKASKQATETDQQQEKMSLAAYTGMPHLTRSAIAIIFSTLSKVRA
jgi:hypothetical protein